MFYTISSFYVYYVYYEIRPSGRPNATFSERTVTITLAENCAEVCGRPYHYAHIKNTLTDYGLVYHLGLSKKKSTGGIGFFIKVFCPENENESIPLFWGSDATKKSKGRFRGIKFREFGDKTFVLYSITNGVLFITHVFQFII